MGAVPAYAAKCGSEPIFRVVVVVLVQRAVAQGSPRVPDSLDLTGPLVWVVVHWDCLQAGCATGWCRTLKRQGLPVDSFRSLPL